MDWSMPKDRAREKPETHCGSAGLRATTTRADPPEERRHSRAHEALSDP